MPFPDFYDVNENRKYPFVFPTLEGQFLFGPAGNVGIQDEWVLDCGFTMGVLSEHTPGSHSVRLYSISRSGDQAVFTFTSDAPGMTGEQLSFIRYNSDEWGATDYVESTSGPEYGVGFLVTGKLDSFFSTISDGESYVSQPLKTPAIVEPALITSEYEQTVHSITVGNLPRVAADNCCAAASTVDSDTVNTVASGLQGDVAIAAGRNTIVSIATSSVRLTAAVGAGTGEPCSEVAAYPGESYPAGSVLLSGGPACGELVFTVNGVSPSANGAFNLFASNGIYVDTDPSAHTITIRAEIEDSVYCETD